VIHFSDSTDYLKNKFGLNDGSFLDLVSVFLAFSCETTAALFISGYSFLNIFIYLIVNYIVYRFRCAHYSKIELKITLTELDFRRMRIDEIMIDDVEEEVNELIGWIPALWLSDMFIRTCANLAYISLANVHIIDFTVFWMDNLLFYLMVIGVIIFVGRISDRYDVNTIVKMINKNLSTELSNDCCLQFEKIHYLLEMSSRCTNKTKSCNLFTVNANLILSFFTTVIPFSVMIIQLMSTNEFFRGFASNKS